MSEGESKVPEQQNQETTTESSKYYLRDRARKFLNRSTDYIYGVNTLAAILTSNVGLHALSNGDSLAAYVAACATAFIVGVNFVEGSSLIRRHHKVLTELNKRREEDKQQPKEPHSGTGGEIK